MLRIVVTFSFFQTQVSLFLLKFGIWRLELPLELESFLNFVSERALGVALQRKRTDSEFTHVICYLNFSGLDSFLHFVSERALGVALKRKRTDSEFTFVICYLNFSGLDSFLHFVSERALGVALERKRTDSEFTFVICYLNFSGLDSFLHFVSERALGVALKRKPSTSRQRGIAFFPCSQAQTSLACSQRKKPATFVDGFLCSGDWTRTSDLRVMSPTSYLLLYPAIWTAKIQRFFSIIKISKENYLSRRNY